MEYLKMIFVLLVLDFSYQASSNNYLIIKHIYEEGKTYRSFLQGGLLPHIL